MHVKLFGRRRKGEGQRGKGEVEGRGRKVWVSNFKNKISLFFELKFREPYLTPFTLHL